MVENINSVTIIGLGLIGGSIAKALKEKLNIKNIMAIDSDKETLELALDEGLIYKAFTHISPCIKDSDIIFICTPVNQTLDWVKNLLPLIKSNCIITDTGSTKLELINGIENIKHDFHFIGGHPMAGSEKSGYSASKGHLFENAYYILTPCSKSDKNDLALLSDLVKNMGSIPIKISAKDHDDTVGAISHLPHIIAASLVNMIKKLDSGDNFMQKLAAGGFKDITRISSSNPYMWTSICMSNKQSILNILQYYINLLNKFKDNLDSQDNESIYSFFNKAKDFRDSIDSMSTGLIPGTYEIVVDVIDKPGIIGKIATLLANNNINIKNINVNNSREFEIGVLIISLPDYESMVRSCEVLIKYGYKIISRK